jgi:type IV secretion system protein TrbH
MRPLTPLDDKIASDAVDHLARLYPPAKTQFNLEAAGHQAFTDLLAEKLRARGYAITEAEPVKTGLRSLLGSDTFGDVYPPKAAIAPMPPVVPAPQPAPGIALRYALDHSRTGELSRITLKIGNSLLARAYVSDNGSLAPAGAWTFRE